MAITAEEPVTWTPDNSRVSSRTFVDNWDAPAANAAAFAEAEL